MIAEKGPASESATVINHAHPILGPIHGPIILRKLAESPEKEIEDLLPEIGITESLLRMTKEETTLGGLLPSKNPAKHVGTSQVTLDSDLILNDTTKVPMNIWIRS